jgi:hypothetical protein
LAGPSPEHRQQIQIWGKNVGFRSAESKKFSDLKSLLPKLIENSSGLELLNTNTGSGSALADLVLQKSYRLDRQTVVGKRDSYIFVDAGRE